MLENKINFKLINLFLLAVIVVLICLISNIWLDFLLLISKVIAPFFIGFVLAYICYPILKVLQKKIPKSVSVFIISTITVLLIILSFAIIVPLIYEEGTVLFKNILEFILNLSKKYNINFTTIENAIDASNGDIIGNLPSYIGNGAISLIGTSINALTGILITYISFVYFLIDLDNIKEKITLKLQTKKKKLYQYIKTIEKEMKAYLGGVVKFMLIQLFEYIILFYIIGHPNYLLLGILAALTTLVPYFGGLFTNLIALITAFTISQNLFLLTLIIIIIFSNIDAYLIAPKIFEKSNKLHPLLIIFSVFAFGKLFGIIGIVAAVPLTIFISSSYKYYKSNIKTRKEVII